MSRQFLKARRDAEFPVFKKVLEALPKDGWDYKPHERSPSTRGVAWKLALEARACCDLVDHARIDWQHVAPPESADEIIKAFEENYQSLTERVAKLDDDGWQRKGQLLADGKVMQEAPIGEFLWFFFFDAIHHRGQLSTYIRPMGGKVPAIYGPSGDDPGQ